MTFTEVGGGGGLLILGGEFVCVLAQGVWATWDGMNLRFDICVHNLGLGIWDGAGGGCFFFFGLWSRVLGMVGRRRWAFYRTVERKDRKERKKESQRWKETEAHSIPGMAFVLHS